MFKCYCQKYCVNALLTTPTMSLLPLQLRDFFWFFFFNYIDECRSHCGGERKGCSFSFHIITASLSVNLGGKPARETGISITLSAKTKTHLFTFPLEGRAYEHQGRIDFWFWGASVATGFWHPVVRAQNEQIGQRSFCLLQWWCPDLSKQKQNKPLLWSPMESNSKDSKSLLVYDDIPTNTQQHNALMWEVCWTCHYM